jgi:hypothetical protein
MSNFNNWINAFIAEKGIDLEQSITVEGESGQNIMPVSMIIDGIKSTTANEKAQIKKTFVMIDFKNGDVLHFIRHLAQALAH